jgi:hypothetical protein
METEEWVEIKELSKADFRGLPREALVATIHYLADRVLRLKQELADRDVGR